MELIDLISNVGFPIALVLLLGAYLKDLNKTNYEDFKSREHELRCENKEISKILAQTSKRLEDTLEHHTMLDNRMEDAEELLDVIEDKIDVIHDKVDKLKNDVGSLL